MKRFYTYLHCRPDGSVFYVGKGCNGRSHQFKNRTAHHLRIIAKYGRDNIRVYVFPCESEEQVFADEKQHIRQLRGEGVALVNLCDGGEGVAGLKRSEESRARISASQMGRKWSPESIAKRSATNVGSKRSAETRARMSAAATGKAVLPETRAKLAAANIGKTHTPEARAKISAAHIGNRHALGYRHTADALAKIAAASRAFKRTPEHCAKISAALRSRVQ